MAPPAAIDDSMQARISADCPDDVKTLLYHAWAHDTSDLKKLLDVPGKASAQDPKTGETLLHAAIRACGPAPKAGDAAAGQDGEEEEVDDTVAQEAKETVHELFLSGAIWNDVDEHDETPGCLAWRLGHKALYELCVDAGVRAELLFGLLDGYEELSSGAGEDDAEVIEEEEAVAVVDSEGNAAEATVVVEKPSAEENDSKTEQKEEGRQEEQNGAVAGDGEESPSKRQKTAEPEGSAAAAADVNSEQYLASKLTFDDAKLVDAEGNGVMMAWETDIMRRSVDALLRPAADNDDDEAAAAADKPAAALAEGKHILNIGFGMGIIDGMFAATSPDRHHIIEAHPAVLAHIDAGHTAFGADWEARTPPGQSDGAFKVHRGRWQDVVPQLLEAGEVYDAIYFDTFGEDYAQLKMFFTEYIPGLLDQNGRFGFFNGLGADRRICYDVYTKVVEMHMADAGMDVEWEVTDVDMQGMEEAGKQEWEGVRRRYWTLDKYRLPICTFMG